MMDKEQGPSEEAFRAAGELGVIIVPDLPDRIRALPDLGVDARYDPLPPPRLDPIDIAGAVTVLQVERYLGSTASDRGTHE
jgi:hypothetical protein